MRRRGVVADPWGAAAWTAAAMAVVLALSPRMVGVPVVRGIVPRPDVGCLACAAVAAASALVGIVRRASGRRASRRSVLHVFVRALIGGVLAAAVALSMVWSLFGLMTTTYHVLAPASPDGCRVVVEEDSFLMAGSGGVYVLRPGEVVAHPVGDFTADDGYRPVTFGTWELEWEGPRTGMLHLGGSGADPVWPGDFEVTCG